MKLLKPYKTKNHFIIAAPRSGTTWLSTMLNAHPDVGCVERRLFGNYTDFVLDDGQKQPRLRVTLDKYVNSILLHHGLPKQKKDLLMRSIISSIKEEEHKHYSKKIIVDKVTPYINTSVHVINQIKRFFPDAKIIYIIRDGRDVLTSGVFHWFNKQQATADLNEFELRRKQLFIENADAKMERFFQDKEIIKWAKEWVQPIKTINTAKKNHKIKVIHFEELLENTEDVLSQCLSFISAKNTHKLLSKCIEAGNFNRMTKGREQGEAKHNEHIRKGIAGDWRNYFTYEDGKLFQEITDSTLVDFGYEENENWFEKFR